MTTIKQYLLPFSMTQFLYTPVFRVFNNFYAIINSIPSLGLFVLFYSVWTPDAKNHKARACDPLLIVNNKGLKYSHNCTVIIIKGSTRDSFDFFGSVWTPDVKNHKKPRGRSHWNNY